MSSGLRRLTNHHAMLSTSMQSSVIKADWTDALGSFSGRKEWVFSTSVQAWLYAIWSAWHAGMLHSTHAGLLAVVHSWKETLSLWKVQVPATAKPVFFEYLHRLQG